MTAVACSKSAAARAGAWLPAVLWTLALFVVLSATATAQTNVGGVIATNTTWSASQSPYVVGSDVIVQNGAVLTIEAGATIYMAAGRALTVQAGSIQAIGTPSAKITITSDNLRTGGTAAAGDWRSWSFNAGTTNTRLEHVIIEYGEGLVVTGSSPTFNYLEIRRHAGAAIRVDLAASPSGVGNIATGNQHNAILVPAGDISGNVTWGLRGIPYLVTGGTVSIGPSPVVASLLPATIEQGETQTITVSGSRLNGAAAALFSAQGVSAEVLPGGSASQVQLSVSATEAAVLGQAELTLLVDAGKARRSNALNVIGPQFKFTSVNPSTVFVGQGTVELELTGSRFSADAVALANGVELPTTFVNSARLRATLSNQTATGVIALAVRQSDPSNPSETILSSEVPLAVATPNLSLTPSTATFVRGTSQSLTLTLPYPAQSGGQTINLVSSVPGVASVPATVSIAEGGVSASVPLTTLATGSTTITASRTGFTSAQSVITVVPPPTLTITPPNLTIGVGRTAQLTITSSAVAPSGGVALTLASSATGVATVPASALIPAGASSTTVTLSSVSVGAASISVSASGYVSGSAGITVRPVSINFPTGALVAPGLSRSVPLSLSDPAPAGGLQIALASSNTAIVTVPASVTVPEGQSAANITLTGVAAGSASINATATGYEQGALPVTVDVVNVSLGVTTTSIPVSMTHIYTLTLSRPSPVGGVTVSLTTANSGVATVSPATIEIPEGQTSGGLVKVAVTGVAVGSTTLSASAPGLNTANVTVNVTAKPVILFNRTSVPVGKGLITHQSELNAELRTGNTRYNPPNGATISLSSSDTSKATVPATLSFGLNSGVATFRVTGVDLTGSTPVLIDATGEGFTSPTSKLSVNVVTPQVNLQYLDSQRTPEGLRDDFRVYLSVPGSTYSDGQDAVANTPIDLAIVAASSPGIVDGFYSAASGGTAITQLVMQAGQSYTGYAHVGVPTAAGNYRVQASMAGGATATSGVINVYLPELRFNKTTVAVGKGLITHTSELSIYRAVNGSAFAGSSAVTINLTSSDPTRVTVPASVTIGADVSTVSFRITGVDLTNGTPVTIDATAAGYTSPAAKLAANVVTPNVNLQYLNSPRSPASQRDDFRVYLSVTGATYDDGQRAVADTPIDLAIVAANPEGIVDGIYSDATGGTAITQLVLQAGQSYTGYAHVGVPTVAGTYRVQASVAGGGSVTSGEITVQPPALRFSKTSVPVGKGLISHTSELTVQRVVNGQPFSGNAAVTVNLTSSDPTRVSVPASVTIESNQNSASFRVTGVDLTGATPVTIDATAVGYTAPTTKLAVSVVTPVVNLQYRDAERTPAGQRDNIRVYLSVSGATYDDGQRAVANIPIDLAIVEADPPGIVDGFYSAATAGTAITQLVLQAGQSYTDYAYVGVPTVSGTYRVRASIVDGGSVTSGVTTVYPPELRFSKPTVIAGQGLKTHVSEVYVYRAVDGAAFSGTAPVTVNLTCSSTAICTVPASVTIDKDSDRASFQVAGVGVGTTTITATAVGYNSVEDLNVNVIAPSLRLSGLVSTRALGQTDAFNVGTNVSGATYADGNSPVAPLVVNLTSSAPDVGAVTPQVTIPVGSTTSNNATFTAQGAGATTVTASSAGFTSATGTVTVSP